jgi:hypothetical protein
VRSIPTLAKELSMLAPDPEADPRYVDDETAAALIEELGGIDALTMSAGHHPYRPEADPSADWTEYS